MCRYYIGYKTLKKRIKHYSSRAKTSSVTDDERYEIVKSFSEILDSQVRYSTPRSIQKHFARWLANYWVVQIEKIVLFLIERQGLLAERLQRLRKQREVAAQECYNEELGLCSPAGTPWLLVDEYRY